MIINIFSIICIVVLMICIVSLSKDNEALREKADIYKLQNDSLMAMLTKLTVRTVIEKDKKNI
ncbi:hypothetical protein [Enterococcus hirae]|uniref:hypothetical protein n=1 Tax=Enterococcus hirae TaxID=1354 RepID=UPI003AAB0064